MSSRTNSTLPKSGPREKTNNGRKTGTSRILTDTPEKQELEEELAKKMLRKKRAQKVIKKVIPESSSEEEIEMNSNSCHILEDVNWPLQPEIEEQEEGHEEIH